MKRYLFCLIGCFSLIVLWRAGAAAKALPPGATKAVPPNVLIFFDTSGSMAWDTVHSGWDMVTWGDGSDNHWGWDTDSSNNDHADSNNYYNAGAIGYPSNDSRMYIGKHVLWDILSSSDLTQGVRYGLMRFGQAEYSYQIPVYWYYPVNSNSSRYIHYDGSYYEGDLLVEIGDNNVPAIKEWIDGQENYPDNKELRADGSTPTGEAMQDVQSYFKGTYKDRRRYDGSRTDVTYNSPIQYPCQQNYVIVITDGQWNGNVNPATVAGQLRNLTYNGNTYDVKTYVIGFSISDQKTIDSLNDMAAQGGTGNALFADDFNTLSNALRGIINSIIASAYSLTTPVINPGVSGEGNVLYMASYIPVQNHQWQGHLRKYHITQTGDIDDRNGDGKITGSDAYWDAGYLLGDTGGTLSSSGRQIFTIGSGLGSSLNNFTLSNDSSLKTLLGYGTDSDLTNTDKLIDFVRGVDVFDEDSDGNSTEDRWKLADIYHSIPMEVGKPPYYIVDCGSEYLTFKANHQDRPRTVYAGGNDGMLHAFDADSTGTGAGAERWAFIPPDLLGKLKNMVSAYPNESNSEYYVDGAPTIDDMYIQTLGATAPAWRTILAGGERQGGSGYFALDVSDPLKPIFMWDVAHDASLAEIHVWDYSGVLSTLKTSGQMKIKSKSYAYDKLGETWSRPTVSRFIPTSQGQSGSDQCKNNDYTYVAAVGAGYSTDPDLGDAIYFMDLADGSLVHSFTLGEGTTSNTINNNVVSEVSLINDQTGNLEFGYVGDLDGRMHKMDLSDRDPTNWSICTLFDMETTDANQRSIYFAPEVAEDSTGTGWVMFGTGNINDFDNPAGDNYFVVVRDENINGADLSCPAGSPFDLSALDDVTAAGTVMSAGARGYKIHFAAGEKLAGKPMVYNGVLYFTTYTPSSSGGCDLGTAALYAVVFHSGAGAWDPGKKKKEIGPGVPTAPVVRGNNIYIGINGEPYVEPAPPSVSGTPGAVIDSWYH